MFLTTVTGGQLINQSGGYIYTPPQYIGADFDEDGIPDLVELYGLLPNGELLETSPYETDSDFDGIPDNEEFNYVHSFLTPDVTLAEYINAIKANSFPGVSDSDGDGISDDQDEYPTISTSDIELEIANFLNNADYFEIAFFLGIPNYENTLYDNRGFLSWYPDPIDRIRLIEIFRKHANTSDIGAYYEDLHACGYIVGDLSKNFLGLYKHIEFADLMLTCYELASQGTTFAEMSMLAYQSWAEDMKLVASIWLFGVTEQYCKQMSKRNENIFMK